MSRFPTIRARELGKSLEAHGYVMDRQRGSYLVLWNEVQKRAVTVPVHSGRDLGRGLTLDILKQAGLTADDFLNWR